MKIAFLGPAYPLRGGIAQFITLLALEAKKEYKVKIFSFQKQYPKFLFPGKEQVDRSETKPDLEIEAVVTPYNPFSWPQAVKKITDWQPDILVLKYWIPFFAPCFGWIIRKLKKQDIKIVYAIDNIVFHEKWPFSEQLTKYALAKADELITMSETVFEDAIKLLPKANIIKGFHPTYNCYNLGKYSRKSARKKLQLTDKKIILFFGYIKPYKGLELLINSIPQILQKIPNAHLIIVGEVYGDDLIYIKLIESLDLQRNVAFLNRFATNEEVELYYKAADVLALPYLSATQSGVVQIAYDFGLGAVCTPVGGLPELVIDGKTGVVADVVSEEAFADGVEKYFQLDKAKMTKNILAENSKYSWQEFLNLVL